MTDTPPPPAFQSFREFYPWYLGEHRHPVCRRLHVLGTTLVLLITMAVLVTGAWAWLWSLPIAGYGPAWIGHFYFEKNRPATFRHPLWSLAGDFVMYRDVLTGRLPFSGNDTIATLIAVATETPPAPQQLNPEIPPALSELVLQLLAKTPDERPALADSTLACSAVRPFAANAQAAW